MTDFVQPDQHDQARIALEEIGAALQAMDADAIDAVAREILNARRIVCFGMGREGLMMRALCMRLTHLGLQSHMAGDVTAPPVGPEDLFLLSSGPGDLTITKAMSELATNAGARVALVTAQPVGVIADRADLVCLIPAQTMADDEGSPKLLPMGTGFEIAMLVAFDLLALRLQARTGQTATDLRHRHANLE